MAVPKKRKKLDEATKKNGVRPKTSASSVPKPPASKKAKTVKSKSADRQRGESTQKLDKALEIMENIEKTVQTVEQAVSAKDLHAPQIKLAAESEEDDRMGFRFQIYLDALMPEAQKDKAQKKSSGAKRSPLVEVRFTIPFIWNIPVIGDVARNLVDRFKTIRISP